MASKKINGGKSQSSFLVLDSSAYKIHLDSVQLVRQIKKHPAIYNNFIRRDLLARFSSWETIICGLLPGFSSMQISQKSEIRTNIRLRWRYMREAFRRHSWRKYPIVRGMYIEWLDEMKFIAPYLVKSKSLEQRPVNSKNMVAASEPLVEDQITPDTNLVSLLPAVITSDSEFMIETFISAHNVRDTNKSPDVDLNFLFALLNALQKITPRNKILLKNQLNSIMNFFKPTQQLCNSNENPFLFK